MKQTNRQDEYGAIRASVVNERVSLVQENIHSPADEISVQCESFSGDYKICSTANSSNSHPETQNQLNNAPPTSPHSLIWDMQTCLWVD